VGGSSSPRLSHRTVEASSALVRFVLIDSTRDGLILSARFKYALYHSEVLGRQLIPAVAVFSKFRVPSTARFGTADEALREQPLRQA
jgi:hypothetical protein